MQEDREPSQRLGSKKTFTNQTLERFGHFHTSIFNAEHLYNENITEEEIVALEIICKRLINQRDHELTLFLGWSWKHIVYISDDNKSEQTAKAYQKALHWYTEAMNYEDCREMATDEITRIQQELSTLNQ